MTVEPDNKALQVARDVAEWHIGDPSWGNLIVRAYLNPEDAKEQLKRDKGETE